MVTLLSLNAKVNGGGLIFIFCVKISLALLKYKFYFVSSFLF